MPRPRENDFPPAVKRELERRVASVCSKPGCGRITTGPHSDPGRSLSVGEAGHIHSAANAGPRPNPALSAAEIRSIANGIWLCCVCHRIVDADEAPFSPQTLRDWKEAAEAHARAALELGEKREQMPQLISLLHRSMELIPEGSLARSLPLLLRNDGNREVVLDTRDLFEPERPKDLGEIARRQVLARDALWGLRRDFPSAEVAYYGIAHVPTAIHMGMLLGTRTSAHYAERDRDGDAWHWISEVEEPFPPLELQRGAEGELGASDVAIAVSVSYPITDAQITASVGEMPRIHLSVPEPSLDLVRTKPQVENYSAVFRDALERVSRSPSVERVHLFAAVPMSIAFALGRQIRPTVHPTVYAYNYRRSSRPPYCWRMVMLDDPNAVAQDGWTPER